LIFILNKLQVISKVIGNGREAAYSCEVPDRILDDSIAVRDLIRVFQVVDLLTRGRFSLVLYQELSHFKKLEILDSALRRRVDGHWDLYPALLDTCVVLQSAIELGSVGPIKALAYWNISYSINVVLFVEV